MSLDGIIPCKRTGWVLACYKAVMKKSPGSSGEPQVEQELTVILLLSVITQYETVEKVEPELSDVRGGRTRGNVHNLKCMTFNMMETVLATWLKWEPTEAVGSLSFEIIRAGKRPCFQVDL